MAHPSEAFMVASLRWSGQSWICTKDRGGTDFEEGLKALKAILEDYILTHTKVTTTILLTYQASFIILKVMKVSVAVVIEGIVISHIKRIPILSIFVDVYYHHLHSS